MRVPRCCLILALLLSPAAHAEFKGWIHLGSHHTSDGDYNERNGGFGLELALSETWSVEAGQYRNSFSRTTRYLWAGYELLERGHWRVQLAGGAVDGYDGAKFEDGQSLPIVAGLVTYRRARFLLIPDQDLSRIAVIGLSARILEW